MPKPVVSGTTHRVCLRDQWCGDWAGPEEGAKTSLSPGRPDKLGWGSRNWNQTKKNKPLPAAGWELPRALALSLALPLPSSFLPTAELSPALLSSRLALTVLFNLKPQLHTASPGM